MTDLPPDDENKRASRRNRQTRYIATLALAVAVGHVIYAAIRDHVYGGQMPWWFLVSAP